MRKIETHMLDAVRTRRAWAEGNTAVSPWEREDGAPMPPWRKAGRLRL